MADHPDDLLAFQTALLLELLRESDVTAIRLLRLYKVVYDRLSRDWLALLEEIEAERSRQPGDPTTAIAGLLLRRQRIERLRLQTAAQIAVFAREAARLVRADQAMAVDVARVHAERVLSEAARGIGVDVSFATLPKRALEHLVGRFNDGEPLRQLFDQLGADAARKAEESLFTAVAIGQVPSVASRNLRTQLSVPLTRAMAISRTELLTAYRSATLETYRENGDVVRAWRWNAHLGPRTCSACISLHGTVWPLSVRFFPGHTN